jgi:hypothetical protein
MEHFLVDLEPQLLRAAQDLSSPAVHELVSPDAVVVTEKGCEGREALAVRSLPDQLDLMPQRIRVVPVSDDIALVSYRIDDTAHSDSSYCVSVWQRTGSDWQLICHQRSLTGKATR